MAIRCPDCGGLLEMVGSSNGGGAKSSALHWCKYDGGIMRVSPKGRERWFKPSAARAYSEFAGYLSKDHPRRMTWNTIFFQFNDSRETGVMLNTIMGIHEISKNKHGSFVFDVSTTACTRIHFSYESDDLARIDRNRLIVSIEKYHRSSEAEF